MSDFFFFDSYPKWSMIDLLMITLVVPMSDVPVWLLGY